MNVVPKVCGEEDVWNSSAGKFLIITLWPREHVQWPGAAGAAWLPRPYFLAGSGLLQLTNIPRWGSHACAWPGEEEMVLE